MNNGQRSGPGAVGSRRHLAILGTRGVPGRHGGFETFAEQLALYLVERGWHVTVYCQAGPELAQLTIDQWRGIERVTIPVTQAGAPGTIAFDWKATCHVAKDRRRPLVLTLGYNTAAFCVLYRLAGLRNIINMDGLEWMRDKWRWHERAWLWANERIACLVADHLVADHPEIAAHLATRAQPAKITTIPYGAHRLQAASPAPLQALGLEADRYALVIARPEPENSVLEIVRAFSRRPRSVKLVVLGNYHPDTNPYHREVLAACGPDVLMPGAIYDPEMLAALRCNCRLYVHGHRVGGTNPSLVEALGSASAVLAHDNRFNRWVAGEGARYFADEDACERQFEGLLQDSIAVAGLRQASRARFEHCFRWETVLSQYEDMLAAWVAR